MSRPQLDKIGSGSTLQATQEWFASIITRPLDKEDKILPTGREGMMLSEEAARYVNPSNLQPHQRMQIYNQQYWWRLLNTLHESFPLVTRLFGYQAFNEEVGIPYLLKYPPNHWSLNLLGERLPKWVNEEYRAPDQLLIQHATNLDWAFTSSFIAAEKPSIHLESLMEGNPENLLSYTFYLQPHMHLFKWDYDLFEFRIKFLEHEVEYWLENNFPTLPKGKTYHFVLFRASNNIIHYKEIGAGEQALLEVFSRGATIEEACGFLEKQESAIYEEAVEHLQEWLQEWTHRNWLTLQPTNLSLERTEA